MKLRANSVRQKLDANIKENELREQEELRLKNEEKNYKRKLNQERKKQELLRLRDINHLELLVLESALEGRFQVEVDLDDLDFYHEPSEFSQLNEYGFEIVSNDSQPISNIKSFVLTADIEKLENFELTLTNHLDKLIEICKSKKLNDFLTYFFSYKKSDDVRVNVEFLTLLLSKSIQPIREFIDEDDSDFDNHDDFVHGSIDWHLKILSQVDFLEEDLEIHDLDDPTCSVTYEQFFLLWKKSINSNTDCESLFEACNFHWIAKEDGQQFFYYIQKAIDKSVNDLSSILTLHLTIQQSETLIIIDSDEVFDLETEDTNESTSLKNYYFNCPLKPSCLVKVFEHLEFTTLLYQDDEDNANSYILEIIW